MEVIAIAAGHAITSVLVKVVAPSLKKDRRTVPKILCATTEQMKWGLLRKIPQKLLLELNSYISFQNTVIVAFQ